MPIINNGLKALQHNSRCQILFNCQRAKTWPEITTAKRFRSTVKIVYGVGRSPIQDTIRLDEAASTDAMWIQSRGFVPFFYSDSVIDLLAAQFNSV
jgi:hypothetical protein